MDSLLPSVPTLLVLEVLDGTPGHGYEIARRIEERSERALRLKEGTLYPLLYRLERDGILVGEWQEAANGRRLRVYRLTEVGSQRLAHSRAEWTARTRGVERILRHREVTNLGPI